MNERELRKIEKQKKFKDKITKIKSKKKVNVIPAGVSLLGATTINFEKYITPVSIDI